MANATIAGLLKNSSKLGIRSLSPVSFNISRSNQSWKPQDCETHTGQKFESDDYRLSRFVGREKLVNPNWAVNLIDEIPPKLEKSRVVSCDGGGGPLGHPKVYINLDKPGTHACGYCGLRFYKEDEHH